MQCHFAQLPDNSTSSFFLTVFPRYNNAHSSEGRLPLVRKLANPMQTLQIAWNTIVWNPQERRLRALWRILIHYALWVLAALLLYRAVGPSLTALLSTLFPEATAVSNQVVRFSLRLIAALAGTWLVVRYIDRRMFRDLGLILDANWWHDLLFGLALGAMLMTLVFVLEYSLGWISIRDRFAVTLSGDVPFAIALIGPIVVFVVVGISEEILSRGYQLRNMGEGLNFGQQHPVFALLTAWVLSSCIFGLLHAFNPNATWISTAYLMLAGLFLGLGLVLTGRLGLPIGLHISWNFFQGNVYGFPVSGNDYTGATFIAIRQGGPDLWTGGAFGPEAGLIGIGAIILGCLLTVLWVYIRYGKIALYRPYTVYRPRPEQEYYAESTEQSQV